MVLDLVCFGRAMKVRPVVREPV
eukprot:COSAG01_NODE_38897_length_483_cov_44.148438_1_plen_22_part_10